MDAFLGGKGPIVSNRDQTSPPAPRTLTSQPDRSGSHVDEQEFANLNGLSYSLDELIGNEEHHRGDPHDPRPAEAPAAPHEHHDASVSHNNEKDGPSSSLTDHASVALSVAKGNMPWTVKGVPRPGNKMFFAVVYLAPGCAFSPALSETVSMPPQRLSPLPQSSGLGR
jgi:phosphatidylserine decarboxylase